jgi:hypothetical protein
MYETEFDYDGDFAHVLGLAIGASRSSCDMSPRRRCGCARLRDQVTPVAVHCGVVMTEHLYGHPILQPTGPHARPRIWTGGCMMSPREIRWSCRHCRFTTRMDGSTD